MSYPVPRQRTYHPASRDNDEFGLPAISLRCLVLAVIFCIASGAAIADKAKRAEHFIAALSDQALTLGGNEALSETERLQRYDHILQENLDMEWIGRFVLGRYLRRTTPEQREHYTTLFRQTILHTLYKHFVAHSAFELKIDGSRIGKKNKYVFVTSRLHLGNQLRDDVKLVWRLLSRDDSFKVVDISIEGVSLAITRRKEYSALIQNNNGQVTALLDTMQQTLERLQEPK